MAKRRGRFDDVMQGYALGTSLGGKVVEGWAGEEYKKGTGITAPEDAERIAEYQDVAKGLRGEGDERFAHMTPEERTAAATAYEKATGVGQKYYVGRGDGQEGTAYEAAPTRPQIHLGGLEAKQRYYEGRGDERESQRLGERIDTGKTNELQRKAAENALSLFPLQKALAEEQVAQLPLHRRILTGQAELGDVTLEAAKLQAEFKAAAMKGLPGMVKFYDNKIMDNKVGQIVRDPKTGAVSIYRIDKDNPDDRVLWKTFKGNPDTGYDAETEASAFIHAQMGDPKNLQELLKINATYTAKAQNQELLKAIYAARAANKETPSQALAARAEAMAAAYVGADETGKLTPAQALKKAYQVLTKDPDAKPVRTFAAEVDKVASAEYQNVDPTKPGALGAFDAKYPGWRAYHFGVEPLKPGPGATAPGATPTGGGLGTTPRVTPYSPNRPAAARDPRAAALYTPRAGADFSHIPSARDMQEEQDILLRRRLGLE